MGLAVPDGETAVLLRGGQGGYSSKRGSILPIYPCSIGEILAAL